MIGRDQPSTFAPAPRRWRAPSLFALAGAIALLGCVSRKEVEEAKVSSYDTEFSIVYDQTVAAVRDAYPNLTENPQKGSIATSWHQVYLAGDATDPSSAQASSRTPGGTHSPQTGLPGDTALKRYFIRFDVTVAGGRPWRVRLVGRAAQWDAGNAVPTEYRGASRPPWLEARTDALVVAIHRRLKQHAVNTGPAPIEADTADLGPRSDPKAFAEVPVEAAQALAGLRDEILRRDWTRLTERLAPDVSWSLGADPGRDAALALWQADPSILDEMQRALDAGCASADADVVCPKAAADPAFAGYRLRLARRADGWKVTAFLVGQ